ncbi:MAG: YIP1 family protein [Verrucomicrobia bacterium]|nr:YIP1 family protein [Verrucomicrobiota bacterium]
MDQPPPILETPPPPETLKEPTMSLGARLLNIFAIPGDVFEEVRTTRPSVGNWLVPALIACAVGIVSVVIVLSQPAIQQQIREKQEQAMEKKFEELIQAGKLTREQADQQIAAMEKLFGANLQKVFGSMGVVFYSFARIFFWALVLWLIGRWLLQAPIGYMKATEVAGLAGMISVLGAIVALLLRVNFSNPAASPSLALTVGEFDEKNVTHMLLAMVNLFDVWQVGVMASGLARLAGAPFVRALLPLIVFWLLMSFALGTLSVFATRLGG